MMTNSIKRKILETIHRLPDEASIEDAIERLYFLAKVERGLAQADAGETISHADAKDRLKQ